MAASAVPDRALARPRPVRWSPAAPGAVDDVVRVFDHDPDLLAGVPADAAAQLRHQGLARKLWIEPGTWEPPVPVPERRAGCLGLLVLDGLLQRCVTVEGRECPELLGAGDVLRPWDSPGELSSVGLRSQFSALTPTTVAVLDARFARVACAWPSVTAALVGRGLQRSRALAAHLAIVHVRHAERRLQLLLWHLADRWGRVTPDGVLLPLPLTHELLAHLACLRRPTASTALQALTRAGELRRMPDGAWLLTGVPPAEQADAAA